MSTATILRAAALGLALTGLAGAASAQDLVLKGLDGQSTTLTPARFAALPHVSKTIAIEGKTYDFSGVPLSALLARVGAPSGEALRGRAMRQVVLVTCQDGYGVVLALAETDPKMKATAVILADSAGGAPLPANAGPYRLVVEGDLRAARSARMVTGIALVRVGDPAP